MEEKTLVELYDWLDTIPFSRPKRNLARDFSDGVLAAELIKNFIPQLVELHNYPPTNSLEQKKVNWSMLNKKVLKKLDFPLSEQTQSELASSQRGTTEYFLCHLRAKITSYLQKPPPRFDQKRTEQMFQGLKIRDSIATYSNMPISPRLMKEESINAEGEGKLSQSEDSLETVPREAYEQKVHELLREKQETILSLKARIRDLEYLVLQQDHRINDLKSQLKDSLQANGELKKELRKSPHKKHD